jgi:DNA-binding transcriptional MocR family regulator
VTEHLGFQLIAVEMDGNGPDMNQVESLVAGDDTIKGIWCVPRYSNPDGTCYSRQTVQRLANMDTAATDFRIMWDNAYAEHHLSDDFPALENIAQCCQSAGNQNRVVQFASTSKISHPGSGVAAMAGSEANIAAAKEHISVQSIGPDKVNQFRHLMLFNDLAGLRAHMKKHAALIKPKFDRVLEILQRQLGDLGIAQWTKPKGGYFISLDIADGNAKRVVQLAAEAGVKLTAAGAPFPYGVDPRDRNIRIAPTFPSLDDINQATEVLATCVKLAASE